MTSLSAIRIPETWAVDVAEDGSIIISDEAGGDIVAVFPPDLDQWLPALSLAFCAVTADAGRLHQGVQQWARHKASVYQETRRHLADGDPSADVPAEQGDA